MNYGSNTLSSSTGKSGISYEPINSRTTPRTPRTLTNESISHQTYTSSDCEDQASKVTDTSSIWEDQASEVTDASTDWEDEASKVTDSSSDWKDQDPEITNSSSYKWEEPNSETHDASV
jgi:hypothetical protein